MDGTEKENAIMFHRSVNNREMAFVLIDALKANGILNQKTYENIRKKYRQGDEISVYRGAGQEQIA